MGMTKKYVHLPLDEPIGPEDRAYMLEEELLEYKDKKVLCLHSRADACRLCDGSSIAYLHTIYIKGYIVADKYRITLDGEVVSELQPIEDEAERQELVRTLKEKYGTSHVYFE